MLGFWCCHFCGKLLSFLLLLFSFRSFSFRFWILEYNDLIVNKMNIHLFFFFPPNAALFLCRDTGCKDTLIWPLFHTNTLSLGLFHARHKERSESSRGALLRLKGERGRNRPNRPEHVFYCWVESAIVADKYLGQLRGGLPTGWSESLFILSLCWSRARFAH